MWDEAYSVQETGDGYIVAGYTGSFGAGSSDFLIAKLSHDGLVGNCIVSDVDPETLEVNPVTTTIQEIQAPSIQVNDVTQQITTQQISTQQIQVQDAYPDLNVLCCAAGTSLANFPCPFVKASNLNVTFILGDSKQHGPYGWGAETKDVLGSVGVASKLGVKALGGVCSQMLDTAASTNDEQPQINWSLVPETNLIVVGGPGVNNFARYYDGFNGCPFRLSWSDGVPVIHSDDTGNSYGYQLGPNGYDHALVALHRDHGRHVLVVWGLTYQGTMAACQLLQYFENYPGFLGGRALIVKWVDSDRDGVVGLSDTLSVVEAWSG